MIKPRFSERIKNLFKSNKNEIEFYEELEDTLIESDIGVTTAMEIVREFKQKSKKDRFNDREVFYQTLKPILKNTIKAGNFEIRHDKLNFLLILGVNGVGKTTTIAKLAEHIKNKYRINDIILSAGDTFRAAAVDQLQLHGKKLGLRVVSQAQGADPGAVIYDSIESAMAKGGKVVIADTAGRMHNKVNLIRELQKIDRIISNKIDSDAYKKILIIDATTGQNGLKQAEIFNEAVGIDSIIITKYDSSAKGGTVFSISKELGIPFSFIGNGEKVTDLMPFEIDSYLDNLLGIGC